MYLSRLVVTAASIIFAAAVAGGYTYYTEPATVPADTIDSLRKCIPPNRMQEIIRVNPQLSNLRAVAPGKVKTASEIFNSTPPAGNMPWNSAWLMDGPDGTGSLLVGVNGMICDGIVFASHFGALVRTLEANPS